MDVAAQANNIGKAEISEIREQFVVAETAIRQMLTRQPGGRTSDKRRRQISRPAACIDKRVSLTDERG